jgi:hypothetical protein
MSDATKRSSDRATGSTGDRRRRSRPVLVLAAALLASLVLGVALASAVAPTVTIENASEVGYTAAKVEGTVDPQGQPTTYRFQYVADAQYQENLANSLEGFEGATTGLEEFTEAAGPVSGELTELAPGTEYHLRLVAENGDGPSEAIAAATLTTGSVSAPVVTIAPVTTFTATSAHLVGHVNPGGTDPAFNTTWHFECTPECPGNLSGGEIAADESSHQVEADAGGLEPNTAYQVKLVAANLGGEAIAETAATPSFKTPAVAPVIGAVPNVPLSERSVRIRGVVNPRNSTIEDCHFEYGPTASYGQSAPCEQEPGSGGAPVIVSADVSVLQPGATYHFRLLAKSAAGTTPGEDQTFVPFAAEAAGECANQARRAEQSSTTLPDCRAYEMVSPPDKNGGDVMSQGTRTRVSTDGDAASFTSLAGFGDVAGTGISTTYLSKRTAAPGTQGWSTHSIMPRVEPLSINAAIQGMDSIYMGEFSDDLSKGVLRTFTNLTDDPYVGQILNLYLTDLSQPGELSPQLLTACPACAAPLTQNATSQDPIAGATPDLGHIIFESKYNLLPGASGALPKLYEWDHGALRLAGVLPASEGGGIAPSSIAGVGALNTHYTLHTISEDGARIFFTVESSPGSTFGDLYMREDHARTVKLNASERSTPDPAGPSPARFETASTDGSKIFFTSKEQLTDTPGSGLYVYDANKPDSDPHNLTLVSVNAAGVGNEVERVAGASDDGSYVYFFAGNQLVAGAPALSNSVWGLYVWHDGKTRFIGSLVTDPDDPAANALGTVYVAERLNSRVSGSGDAFLFRARNGSGLTGYDHSAKNCGTRGTDPCGELYLYHYGTDSLVCVSCNPSGEQATAEAGFDLGTGIGGSRYTEHLTHPLADDGSRAFFTSGEALVAADQDAGANDVYEYDSATGRIHLLSSGRDKNGSYFLDASPSGDDVLFSTRQRLLGWDRDNAYDLYDARSGGGFPELPPASECSSEACQGSPPANAPARLAAGSAEVFGAGNAARKARKHKHKQRKKRHHRARHAHKRAATKASAHANRGGVR